MTPPASDHHERTTPSRIFALLGLYALALAIVYGATSDDRTGLALLVTTSLGSIGFALWLHQHRIDLRGGEPTPSPDPPPYLPTTSTAPLLLGAGTTLVVAGIPLGLWVVVPGLVLIAWGVDRFIRQVIDHE